MGKMNKVVLAMALAGLYSQAFAIGNEDFSLNGYGYQNYGQTSANRSEGVDQRGSLDDNFLGLVASAKINEKSRLWAQLQANSTEQTRFTWFFVDYKLTDNVTARAGRAKFPYGLINEYIDNRAMQVANTVPLAYSGAADMVYDAYDGAGVDWRINTGAGDVLAQVYGGNIYNPPAAIGAPLYPNNPPAFSVPPINDRRLIGGRLTWNTPLSGLRFMVSGNQTQIESTVSQPTMGQLGKESRAMLSAEYVSGPITLQSEYNYHDIPALSGFSGVRSDAYYFQGAYALGDWTPFARYDYLNTDSRFTSDPNFYQKSITVGTNYRLAENLNLRVQDSFNHGAAVPVASQDTAFGAVKPNWNEFVVGVNFMF